MINVSDKKNTLRIAVAESKIKASKEAIIRLKENDLPKKDVLAISKASAVMAAKKTPEFLPYCHPLPIDAVEVKFEVLDEEIIVTAKVTAIWKTGVEMEALTGVNIACLTIYDMCKSISQEMVIKEVKLIERTGGKSDIKND